MASSLACRIATRRPRPARSATPSRTRKRLRGAELDDAARPWRVPRVGESALPLGSPARRRLSESIRKFAGGHDGLALGDAARRISTRSPARAPTLRRGAARSGRRPWRRTRTACSPVSTSASRGTTSAVRRRQRDDDVAVHPGAQSQVRVAELEPDAQGAGRDVERRIEEVDASAEDLAGIGGECERRRPADLHAARAPTRTRRRAPTPATGRRSRRARLGRDVRALHGALLGDVPVTRRPERYGGQRLPGALDRANFLGSDAEQLQAPARAFDERRLEMRVAAARRRGGAAGTRKAPRVQQLLLRRQQRRTVDRREDVAAAHALAGTRDHQLLNPTGEARMHLHDPGLVRRNVADRVDVRGEILARDPRGANSHELHALGRQIDRNETGDVARRGRGAARRLGAMALRAGYADLTRDERHAADRAFAGLLLHDLRMHRAIVLDGRGGELAWREDTGVVHDGHAGEHRHQYDQRPAHDRHHAHARRWRLFAFGKRVVSRQFVAHRATSSAASRSPATAGARGSSVPTARSRSA